MSDKAHVLYRFYSATGQLLYVGITMNPPQRFKSHRDTKEWWAMVSGITVETYSSRDELAQAERRAIQVEHPLHNVVHSKTKVQPPQREPEHTTKPTLTAAEAVSLFSPSPSFDSFASLFSGSQFRDTRYGCQTREQYDRRVEYERAKQQARWDCTLCDETGYRNGYLCDHVDHSNDSGRLQAVQWKVRKERLRVVQGGES